MHATVLVIGAGHAGLAMSRALMDRSIDHVVLERGEVANSWIRERWDSLRLLTPNWQSRLPGYRYTGPDPDGYRTMPETVAFIQDYAASFASPVQTRTTVVSVRRTDRGFTVLTDRGTWTSRIVVLATGACNLPSLPSFATAVPAGIRTITPMQYRHPEQLARAGVLVVGASASGMQIGEELRRSGRPVTLAVGEHIRMPRLYRGRDIQWWMDAAGVLDDSVDEVEDVARARAVPSLQLAGYPDRRTLDLNALSALEVQLVGRLAGIRDGVLQFSGSLANQVALSDLRMNRLLTRLDAWAESTGIADAVEAPQRFEPTRIDPSPRLTLDLASGEVRTIVWATGYRPDYGWLDVPVLDHKGRIRHQRGVAAVPGLYVMGLPFMRRRKSTLIDGAADDAHALTAHIAKALGTTLTRKRLAIPTARVA